MKKFLRILFIIIGIGLLVQFFIAICIMHFNFVLALLLVMGVPLLLIGIFFNHSFWQSKKGKILKRTAMVCYAFLGILFLFYGVQIGGAVLTQSPQQNTDAIIVLGAAVKNNKPTTSLALRLNKAAELAVENYPDAVIVVSGGMGQSSSVSEASVMKNYLIGKGIAENRILTEEKATSTLENLAFSKTLLTQHLGTDSFHCVVVTSDFHVFRSLLMAQSVGLDAAGAGAKTPLFVAIPDFIRECFACLFYQVVGVIS